MVTDQQSPHNWGMATPSRTLWVEGDLPYGRRLTRPLEVIIEDDDGEILVSEPLFHMHAGGSTEDEAVAAFKRILSGYVDVLEERETELGDPLRAQLAYLRALTALA